MTDKLLCKDSGAVEVRTDGGCLKCNADAGERCRLICKFCTKRALVTEDEKDFGICDRCADLAAERYRERKEFIQYHSDDKC